MRVDTQKLGSVVIWRQDRKAVKALGGMPSMTRYKAHKWAQRGSGKWAKWQPLAWIVPASEVPPGVVPIDEGAANAARAKRSAAGIKAAKTAAAKVDEASYALGLMPGSRTAKALISGEIGAEAAKGVAASIKRRHEDTDYDDLLAAGYSQEEARASMQAKPGWTDLSANEDSMRRRR